MRPPTAADIGKAVRIITDCGKLGPYAGEHGRIFRIDRQGRVGVAFEGGGWASVEAANLELGEWVQVWKPADEN